MWPITALHVSVCTQLNSEIAAHAAMAHSAGAIGLHLAIRTSSAVHLFLEYGDSGDLRRAMGHHGLPLEALQGVALSLTAALAEAHAAGWLHRDIKPDNVFTFTGAASGLHAKLGDWGLACPQALAASTAASSGADSVERCAAGTPAYTAPEVLAALVKPDQASAATLLSPKIDVWSLGLTILEAATGIHPYLDSNSRFFNIVLYMVAAQGRAPAIPEHLPEPLRDWLSAALQRDPAKRPTAVELFSHPWLEELRSNKAACAARKLKAASLVGPNSAVCAPCQLALLPLRSAAELPSTPSVASLASMDCSVDVYIHGACAPAIAAPISAAASAGAPAATGAAWRSDSLDSGSSEDAVASFDYMPAVGNRCVPAAADKDDWDDLPPWIRAGLEPSAARCDWSWEA